TEPLEHAGEIQFRDLVAGMTGAAPLKLVAREETQVRAQVVYRDRPAGALRGFRDRARRGRGSRKQSDGEDEDKPEQEGSHAVEPPGQFTRSCAMIRGVALHEREFYNEKQETKPAAFTCPRCRHRAEYQVRWIRRT